MIIIEDGTGLPDAQSYVSVGYADTYHEIYGNKAWGSASIGEKETALVRATLAIDSIYGEKFIGYKATDTQALEWPRVYAIDRDGYELPALPSAITNATLAAALIELGNRGALTAPLERGGMVIRERIGSIETQYAHGATPGKVYPAIESAIKKVLKRGISVRRG